MSLAISVLLADRHVAEWKCVKNKRRAVLILFLKKSGDFPLIVILSRPLTGYRYIPCHTIGKGSIRSTASNIAGSEVNYTSAEDTYFGLAIFVPVTDYRYIASLTKVKGIDCSPAISVAGRDVEFTAAEDTYC